jgi:DNA-binding NarL/FixJ family response regulator
METRLLIVDDDPQFRALARRLLQPCGYTVVADAADGAQALAAVDRVQPTAALVDVQLPDTDGFALTRQLLTIKPGLRIVLTSTDRTLVDSAGLFQCGAAAFVPKDQLAVTDLGPLLRSA